MPGLILELDPASEGTGTPLVLVNNTTLFLLRWDFPEPAEDPLWVGSRDTIGETLGHNRHKNREGQTLVLRAIGASHTATDALVVSIEKKLQKIRSEGGVLQATLPSGKVALLDVLAGAQGCTFDKRWVDNARCEITLTFTTAPFWRSAPILLGDHVDTTTGVLVFTETGIKGSVPGLVKLVIDDDQGQAQRLVIFGLQSRFYSADASAALHFECESRTALGGSATAVGPSGASGSGSNVMRQGGLIPTPQVIMSTQAASGGAHLSHVGGFRVFMRAMVPTSNAGTVSLRLKWGDGDFRVTTLNDPVEIPDGARGSWVLVDLGTVNIGSAVAGAQRWQGQILASSTVIGDDVDLDRFILAPFDEGYGEVHGDYYWQQGTIVARDEFTGRVAASALGATAAPLGGTWNTSGATTDFAAADGPGADDETISRSTTSDASPRLAILGTTNYADVEVAVSYRGSAEIGGSRHHGVIARYVDSSNYLRLSHQSTTSVGDVWLEIVVGGAATQILEMGSAMTVDTWFRLRLVVFASGFGIATWLDANGAVLDSKQFQHAALATGGALATGKVGIIDRNGSAFASTRYYDDFAAATPPAEPLAVAPSRSLEIRSGGAIRQSTDGTLWVPAQLEGFYPRVPPAWAEGRTLRVLVATCRGPKLADSVWADPGIDDLSARLTYTPLSLNLPEA